jgi:hypothetical protein
MTRPAEWIPLHTHRSFEVSPHFSHAPDHRSPVEVHQQLRDHITS